MGLVYKITNSINQKSYIGITQFSLERRWREHCVSSRLAHSQIRSALHDAIRKYGTEVFSIECLQVENSWNNLQELERRFIVRFNTIANGYNLTFGGQGREWTDQQKLNLSQTNTGRKMSDTAKRAISEGAKRRATDPVERALRSERAKRQHVNGSLGIHTISAEGRIKIAIAGTKAFLKHGAKGRKIAHQQMTPEEMSRRSYLRKLFNKEAI